MARSNTMASLTRTPDQAEPTAAEFLGDQETESAGPTPEPVSGTVASKTPALDALVEWLAQACEVDPDDTTAGLESIIRQTLAAPDMAAVLRKNLPQSGRDFLNIPMLWTGVRIIPSDHEDGGGAPYYASLQVMVGDPAEPRVINCGGWKVLAQVMRAVNDDEWPQIVMITEAAKPKKGKSAPLTLVAVDVDGNPITG